ncbi:MAG: hypothetical protein C5B50_00595 [Verrucomicrobia bacterium]|nr:MAG: hypothetical protein C5B50_00595 [Verrucomicrobiota bacterium]
MNTNRQTPNTKHQTPEKHQFSNTRRTGRARLKLGVWSFFGVWCLVFGVCVCSAQAQSPKPAKPANTNAAPVAEVEIPQSLFTIPATAKEGRNPFFPRSAATAPTAPKITIFDGSGLVLNGLTPKPKLAMINSRPFEIGEEGEVRLPGGARVLIRCEEIKDDSATILINGITRRVLRLRSGI